jgi:peptidoglycan/LPS O-acetylase OafA/YrhL
MRNTNIAALTSARFFAALWVVLFHLYASWPVLQNVRPIIAVGYSGVTFFFVLSGFVLSYNYLPRQCGFRDFWSARAARIVPVYLLGLVLSAPFFIHAWQKQGSGAMSSGLVSIVLLQAWIPKAALLWNGPGWSLSCEAFFYLLFPLMAVPLGKLFRWRPVYTFATVWLFGTVPSIWYAFSCPEGSVDSGSHATLLSVVKFNPLLRLPEFVLGIGLGWLFLDGVRMPKARTILILCVAALILLLTAAGSVPYPALHNALLAPIYGLIILSLTSDFDILGNSAFVLLGESSYCLYLLHGPISNIWFAIAKRIGLAQHTSICCVAYLVATVLISIVSYNFIEAPGRAFIRRWLTERSGGRFPRVRGTGITNVAPAES